MKKQKGTARPKFVNSRKAIRKQSRKQKKINRQEHYAKKKTNEKIKPNFTPGAFVKKPVIDLEVKSEPKKKKPKMQPSAQDILSRQRQKELKEAESLKNQMEEQRKKMLSQANEDEDKVIKKLEKQLGLNKSKNKNNYFADDGLDYLLEICDRSTQEQIVAAEKHLANVQDESDFDEDLATGKDIKKLEEKGKDNKSKKGNIHDESEEDSDDDMNTEDDMSGDDVGSNEDFNSEVAESESDVDEEMEESDSEPEEKPTKSKKSSMAKQKSEDISEDKTRKPSKQEKNLRIVSEDKIFSDDEVSHLSDDDDVEGLSDGDDNEIHKVEEKKEKPDVWEDIYGRKRDKEGNVIKEEKGVYIPPHLRNKDSASEKDLIQLKRQIKSILNKLSGTNLHWASTSIENLYSNNSRNSVNTALTCLWLDATVAPSATPDRMVTEHASLVAVLHANVGTEIGAHFLQELSERFDKMLISKQPVGDKRLDNLVSCLAHLYCYKIFQANLIYDILGRLLDELAEKNIECVLVALRIVGGVLRKEEPLALKNFIHDTQVKVAKMNESASEGSRIKFLLDVLMAVKNNNLTKIPNYDPSYTEQLKKTIRGIIRKGNYITPLNISLEDLLKAEERGKWWVVGSAWEGSRTLPESKPGVKLATNTDQKLLELARKQRMNTDVRRSIFCVIMSAEDYMDAFEKLQHLGLKGQQEWEIVHVLLACCLQEKTYNPYYAVLGQKLCDTDRRYQLSIQFTVWDKIKEIDALSKQCVNNLAQFLIHLIMEKGLAISVLKVIQFSDLNKHLVRFMRQILLSIIMHEDLQSSLQVFHRVSKSPKLHMFRESLRLFIQHFLIKNAGKTSVISDEEMVRLKDRSLEVEKILTMHETKLKF